ncbi:MAG: RecQ family ATP-dependent DNA helicase [Desulfobaccales bacterium]
MLEKELQKYFGFNSFKTGQREVISKIVAQQSAAAIFPTGAGKSLCYQLPAMILPHLTLVVSPLLALMKDQIDFLVINKIPAARLDSTLSKNDSDLIFERANNGELKILMISAERFKNERFRSHLQRMKISLLVVDEAHCISEWGHNFRPEYLKLPMHQKEFNIGQVLLLTATATEQVIDDMCSKFKIPRKNIIVTGFYRHNLFLQVTPTIESQKDTHLLQRIHEDQKAPTIVYVTLQKTAEHVADFLRANGINAFPYHAGMPTEARERIQNEFLAGKLDCVVATIAFGMGIDKKDIRRVIHYDLPKSIENYSQEIGRSGRDDKSAFCEVMVNRDNISVLENFIYGDTPEAQAVHKLLQKIQYHQGNIWETKITALSNELNIRILPLKTLLVYLDMAGIIRPKYTRFDEYSFKYQTDPSVIIDKFQGEKQDFVRVILNNSITKKLWTYVNIPKIIQNYDTADRQRVITALEYFNEKGWIDLHSRQAIEIYEIIARDFHIDEVCRTLCDLFENKEHHEIQRIHNMLIFFESSSCISKRLALYFGELIDKERCGHCSFCKNGKAVIQYTTKLKAFDSFNFGNLTKGFNELMGEHHSILNVTKFLCGISSPIFTKFKVKNLPHFGILEKYPFLIVKNWVAEFVKEAPGQ